MVWRIHNDARHRDEPSPFRREFGRSDPEAEAPALDCIRERDPKPSEGWQFLVDNRPQQYYLERTSRKLETAKTMASASRPTRPIGWRVRWRGSLARP
jgi:hypothetical protein